MKINNEIIIKIINNENMCHVSCIEKLIYVQSQLNSNRLILRHRYSFQNLTFPQYVNDTLNHYNCYILMNVVLIPDLSFAYSVRRSLFMPSTQPPVKRLAVAALFI